MKTLRVIYNQIGSIFVIVFAYLLYTQKIELNWSTATVIVALIAVIMAIGKLIPLKK